MTRKASADLSREGTPGTQSEFVALEFRGIYVFFFWVAGFRFVFFFGGFEGLRVYYGVSGLALGSYGS